MDRAAARAKRRTTLRVTTTRRAAASAIAILSIWTGGGYWTRGQALAADTTTASNTQKSAPTKNPAKSVASTSLTAQGDATSEDEGIPAFKPPPVSDPMLTPPPEAQKQVASWEDALDLIRTHSPDYLSNYQKVVVAEARTRIALAAVLPMLNAQGTYVHQFNSASFNIAGFNLVTPPADTLTAAGNATWDVLDATRHLRGEDGGQKYGRDEARVRRAPPGHRRDGGERDAADAGQRARRGAESRRAEDRARAARADADAVPVWTGHPIGHRPRAARRGQCALDHHQRRRVLAAGARSARRGAGISGPDLRAGQPRSRRVRGRRRADVQVEQRHRATPGHRRGARAKGHRASSDHGGGAGVRADGFAVVAAGA